MSLPVTIQKEKSQECSLESHRHYHEGVSEENNSLNSGDYRHFDGLHSSRSSITGGDKRSPLEENPHYTRRIASPKYILSSNGSSSLNSLKSPDISTSLRIPLKNNDILAQDLESTTEGLFITTQQHSSQIHRLISGLEFLEAQVIRQDQTLGKLQKQVAPILTFSPTLPEKVSDQLDDFFAILNDFKEELGSIRKTTIPGPEMISLKSTVSELSQSKVVHDQELLRLKERLESYEIILKNLEVQIPRKRESLFCDAESHSEVHFEALKQHVTELDQRTKNLSASDEFLRKVIQDLQLSSTIAIRRVNDPTSECASLMTRVESLETRQMDLDRVLSSLDSSFKDFEFSAKTAASAQIQAVGSTVQDKIDAELAKLKENLKDEKRETEGRMRRMEAEIKKELFDALSASKFVTFARETVSTQIRMGEDDVRMGINESRSDSRRREMLKLEEGIDGFIQSSVESATMDYSYSEGTRGRRQQHNGQGTPSKTETVTAAAIDPNELEEVTNEPNSSLAPRQELLLTMATENEEKDPEKIVANEAEQSTSTIDDPNQREIIKIQDRIDTIQSDLDQRIVSLTANLDRVRDQIRILPYPRGDLTAANGTNSTTESNIALITAMEAKATVSSVTAEVELLRAAMQLLELKAVEAPTTPCQSNFSPLKDDSSLSRLSQNPNQGLNPNPNPNSTPESEENQGLGVLPLPSLAASLHVVSGNPTPSTFGISLDHSPPPPTPLPIPAKTPPREKPCSC